MSIAVFQVSHHFRSCISLSHDLQIICHRHKRSTQQRHGNRTLRTHAICYMLRYVGSTRHHFPIHQDISTGPSSQRRRAPFTTHPSGIALRSLHTPAGPCHYIPQKHLRSIVTILPSLRACKLSAFIVKNTVSYMWIFPFMGLAHVPSLEGTCRHALRK